MSNYIVSYAQNREDVLLEAFFMDKNQGFYVDVGANYPEYDSVTKLFYDKGWHGINVEPNKRLYELFKTDRPRDTNLNLGISDKAGTLNFREYEGFGAGLSTFSAEMKQVYGTTTSSMTPYTTKYHDYDVVVKTLAQIFAEQSVKTINFMKVDVEGYEYEVLAGNDWQKYRPQVICIEANHVDKDWRPILVTAGYQKVFYDGLNEYYTDASDSTIAANFKYLDALVGRTIITAGVQNELTRREVLNRRLEADRTSLQARLSEQEKYIFQLHQEQESQRRLKQQVKSLARALDAAVLARITRLDQPRAAATSHHAAALTIPPKTTSKQKLIEIAQANDLENFYTRRAARKLTARHLCFILVLQTYKAARKVMRTIAKLVWRTLRKFKG